MAKKGNRGQGEGSLYERKDKTWEAKISIGTDPLTGKLIRKSFYGKSQAEVREKRDKYLSQVRTRTYTEPSELTVGAFVGEWLRVFIQPHKKLATFAQYESLFRVHIQPGIGNIRLQKLSTIKVQEFYNAKSKQLSSSAVSVIHLILNSALEHALDEGLIQKNPAKKTKRPTVQYKEVQPLTDTELAEFLKTAKSHRMFAAFYTDLTTGLRRGELCALKWKNIDLNEGTIKVRQSLNRVQIKPGLTELRFDTLKTKKSKRDIPILADTIKVLNSHKARQAQEKLKLGAAYQDNGLVFCTELGKPYEPRNLLRVHKSILVKTGLRSITLHNLRHYVESYVM